MKTKTFQEILQRAGYKVREYSGRTMGRETSTGGISRMLYWPSCEPYEGRKSPSPVDSMARHGVVTA